MNLKVSYETFIVITMEMYDYEVLKMNLKFS